MRHLWVKVERTAADIIRRSNGINAEGVLIFASTIDHGYEIMASLPAYNSAFLTGKTPKAEREQIIADYKAKRLNILCQSLSRHADLMRRIQTL